MLGTPSTSLSFRPAVLFSCCSSDGILAARTSVIVIGVLPRLNKQQQQQGMQASEEDGGEATQGQASPVSSAIFVARVSCLSVAVSCTVSAAVRCLGGYDSGRSPVDGQGVRL